MRRREFIALIGGVAWPFKVSGQQIAMPVIGFIGSATSQGYATVTHQIWNGLNQVPCVPVWVAPGGRTRLGEELH